MESTGTFDGRRSAGHARRQRGAIAVMFAITLLIMLMFCALALDIGRAYNRRVELQTIADAAAMAAAAELDGTADGVDDAVARAGQVVNSLKFDYNKTTVEWSAAALEFSNSATAPDGDWLDAASARTAPANVRFTRVNTNNFDTDMGLIDTVFVQAFMDEVPTVRSGGRAVAGRSSLNITPLAICAMSPLRAESRNNGAPANAELVEHGFRRGVAYDLMRLNPNGTSPENFVVNPINLPGTTGSSLYTETEFVRPYICSGTVAMPRISGGAISVKRPFPIGSLFNDLNSRFDLFGSSTCSPRTAPPDFNVKPHAFDTVAWMNPAQTVQTAAETVTRGKLETVADLPMGAAGGTSTNYGPLWSYAKPVRYSAYSAGSPEPDSGYPTFGASTATWAALYNPGTPAPTNYPSPQPNLSSSGVNFLRPALGNQPGLRKRRVLNIPLLSCPVAAGTQTTATVLAVGRFFMTVPATATSLPAEFAGLVPVEGLRGQVELYP